MGFGFYLYGIFPEPGPHQLEVKGLDQQPVQSHTIDDFVFLYSEAQQERYLASRKNLLGHERVLEHAMNAGFRTLLPLQFGLIIADWQTVEDQLLRPRGDILKQLFERLDGRREVGIKLTWEEDQELETLMKENEGLRGERDRLEGKTLSMDEVVRIGQAIEQSMAARKQGIIDEFRQTLEPMAIATVENDPMTESMIYNAAYLIPWDDEGKFGHAVEALDHQFENRLRIRYNNFTSPYNFAQLED